MYGEFAKVYIIVSRFKWKWLLQIIIFHNSVAIVLFKLCATAASADDEQVLMGKFSRFQT